MINLFQKELRLNALPVNFIFMIGATMVMIPNYAYYVSSFYLCLGIFFIFNYGQINHDVLFTACLPVRKTDTVKARITLVAVLELIQTVLTAVCCFISQQLNPSGNLAGIDANTAFIGLSLVLLTVFNLVFITSFYRKADKPGMPFLWGNIVFWLGYGLLELPVWMRSPLGAYIDGTDTAARIRQLPILAAGILIWSLGLFVTYKISAKRFETVDV